MKTSKILCLVLTLALLVIGAVAITASAEDAPSVAIASKNLSYDSNISILFAVKTENTDAAPKLNVYTMADGSLSFKKSVDAVFTPSPYSEPFFNRRMRLIVPSVNATELPSASVN